MNVDPTRPHFARAEALARRIHAWGRAEFRREISEGFPLVGSVRSQDASYIIRSLSAMAPQARERLCEALLERAWVTPFRRVTLPPDRQQIVDAWLRGFLEDRSGAPASPRRPKLNRLRLARDLRDRLSPLVGSWDRAASSWPSELVFRSTVAGWTIVTELDLGGRSTGLKYCHSFADFAPSTTLSISLMGWLGIASRTWWDEFDDEYAPAAVECMARVCRHFFEAAPALLTGIEPPRERTS